MSESGAVAAVLTVATLIGTALGLVLRRLPFIGLAAAADNPLTWTGAIIALCSAISFLGKLVLARADKAHESEKATLIAGKDAVIAELRERLEESEARSNRYEGIAYRSVEATKEATSLASEAVRRRDSR